MSRHRSDCQIVCVIERDDTRHKRIAGGQCVHIVVVTQQNASTGCRFLTNSQFICRDDTGGRLCDVSIGHKSCISGPGMHLLIECQEAIGIQQNVAVCRRHTVCGGKADTVNGLSRHRSDCQIVCVIERDDSCGKRIAGGQCVYIVVVTEKDISTGGRFLSDSQFGCRDDARGRLCDVTIGHQSRIGSACVDLLIQCQRTTDRDSNITIGRHNATCCDIWEQ